jgi:RHS repeat-associated protein
MGAWSFGYDTLNRLVTSSAAANAPAPYASEIGCWSYDSFGNRKSQAISTTACANNPPLMSWANYTVDGTPNTPDNGKNQIKGSPNGIYQYDAAGDVTYDGKNTYLYDAEGRICAVRNLTVGVMTGYLYDAGGARVAKGTITSWSCDPSASGFQTNNDYVLGPGGEQAAEISMDANNSMAWQHTNVWAAGKLLGTYDPDGLHFYLNDPLGTRRAQTDYAGVREQTCGSLPFGDGLSCTGSITSPTEHHFTGKERDAESGNDYFGARYYASSMGRFMSPDWSAKVAPVPYAKLDDPQSLNLYAYVGNNPMTRFDADGHCKDGPNDPSCPKLSKEDTAAVKDAVDRSNKPTSDDKKGGNHEEAVTTGQDANGNHIIVPAKPGAYKDVTQKGTTGVDPNVAADPSQQNKIVKPEVQAHVHPAGEATTLKSDNGQVVPVTHVFVQTPSPQDRDRTISGINLEVGAGTTGNASGVPTVYFYNSSGTTCTESYTDFLK